MVKIPAFALAPFILSGALQPSDFDGSLNLSLFLLITTFQWGHKVHICHVYFQVTGFPSTLLSWPNVRVHGLNNCWGRFYFAGETFGLSEENVEVGDHKHPCASTVSHTCITQGSHYLQSLSSPTCDTTQTLKKRQTFCIPEPIPQSTITSLNSSTLGSGARAHPVVLAALPARAAQSVFLVAMATGKHCTHA